MFCSTIIATIGRASLSRAVESVLAQTLPPGVAFEVIVVNDSGRPLPSAAWQAAPNVRVLATDRQERSIARNTGAAAALGRYLHFLDDDDWMLPGALAHFYAAAAAGAPGFIYGRTRMLDRAHRLLLELSYEHTELVTAALVPLLAFDGLMDGNCALALMAGEFIPVLGCLFRADVFAATGGFHPAMNCGEDMDLCRHAALYADLVRLPVAVAAAEWGAAGSTTDRSTGAAQMFMARERILAKALAYPRLLASARAGRSSHWYGRLARLYFSSAAWNLRRGRWGVALRRLGRGLAAAAQAGPGLLQKPFWLGLRHAYYNGPYLRAFFQAQW
jgi:hypothetical protein